ncbi:MAG: HipA domain-containing protein [Bacilli bacterium]|nr:HipA domain-containing protein [Bacilli bacterium]
MERNNGYKNLTNYFKKLLKRKEIDLDVLEEKNIIKPCIDGASAVFWFKYFGVNVLFKRYKNEFCSYSELISEELAKHLGLKNAQYDLAEFENNKGVISYDFRKQNYEYENIYSILLEYFKKVNPEDVSPYEYVYIDDAKTERIDLYNNLEDIWLALEYYLYNDIKIDNKDVPKHIEKLMIELTDRFCFQIISGNYDMHCANILLEISDDRKDISLAPMFDNEDMFKIADEILYNFHEIPRLAIDQDDFAKEIDSNKMLRKYLFMSSEEFLERLERMMQKINEDTIYHIFQDVEEKISRPIPEDIKKAVAINFDKNISDINNIIAEVKLQKRL